VVTVSASGSVGAFGNALDTETPLRDLVAGIGMITADAGQDVFLNEVSGDLNVERINAGGEASLQAAVSILDAGGEANGIPSNPANDVVANSVTLNALAGTIGAPGDDLDIDTGLTGVLDARAEHDIYLIETKDDLIISRVRSTSGKAYIVAQGSIFGAAPFVPLTFGALPVAAPITPHVESRAVSFRAGGDVGSASRPVSSMVMNMEAEISGGLWLGNSGGLLIGGADDVLHGVSAGGPVYIAATSPIDVTEDVTAAADIVLTAGDSADPNDDHLVVHDGVSLVSLSGSVILRSGDDLIIEPGAFIEAATDIILMADFGDADAGIGASIDVRGQLIAGSAIVASGGADADTVSLAGLLDAPSVSAFGGSGKNDFDTLITTDVTNEWYITDVNEGNINGRLEFSGFGSLTGGVADDTFFFTGAGNATGIVDGGAHVTRDLMDWLESDRIQEAAISYQQVDLPIGDTVVAFSPTGGIVRIEEILAIILGEVLPDGTLLLNMGPRAAERLGINIEDGDEEFIVDHVSGDPDSEEGETVAITAFGIRLEYGGVKRIQGIAGDGNDNVTINEGVLAAVNLWGDHPDVMAGAPGNDTLEVFGSGQAILHGGFGDDMLRGGSGDDELIGGPGDDHLFGSEGNDVLLGDFGQVLPAFNADMPKLDPNGSRHRDVLLTDVAYITGAIALDAPQGDLAVVNSLLEADVVLLAGVMNADGSTRMIAPGEAESRAVLLDLVRDGDDTIHGGDGDDAVYGQRGDDTLWGDDGIDFIAGGAGDDTIHGGEGDDVLVGDDAYIDSADAALPNVTHGLLVVPTETSVEDRLGIELGEGTTIVPMMTVEPANAIEGVASLLPHLFGYQGAIPAANSLMRDDGSALVPYASVVTDFAHHPGQLRGNDTLTGGAGNDTIVGDNQNGACRDDHAQPAR